MTDAKFISACGLDCTACPAHVAYLTDDQDLRVKTAAEWSALYHADIKPADVNCVGCRVTGDPHGGYTAMCPVRACAASRNADNCAVCADYAPCAVRQAFERHAQMSIARNVEALGAS